MSVESLDRFRGNLQSLVAEKSKTLPNFHYCDLRIEVREERRSVAENGTEKGSSEDYAFDFGVRVLAGELTSSSGYFGRILGSADLNRLEDVVWDGIKQAHNRAHTSARQKSQMRSRYANLGGSLAPWHHSLFPA